MMNVVALSWLLLSLVTAVVWNPEANQQAEQKTPVKLAEEPTVLIREGHRVFVIEYEREGVLDAAKKGTHDTIHTAADLAKATGETIRHAASQARDKAEVVGDQAVHVIKSGADKTKEAVKSTADKATHAVKDTASSLLHGSEKETSRDEMVKEARLVENETLKSVGDYIQQTGEIYKEKADFVKEKAKDLSDTAREKTKQTAAAMSRNSQAEMGKAGDVSGKGEKLKETVESTFDSTKQKVGGAGLKAKQTVEDTYHSVDDKVSGAGQTVKESVKKSYDFAKGNVSDAGKKIAEHIPYRAKEEESLEVGDVRLQQALRQAGEAAIEKFRQSMDEAYRMTTTGEFKRQIIPVLSEDAMDAKANFQGAGILAADLVKDAASNLSAGSSKGARVTISRIGRLTSKEKLKVGARILHLFAFSTIYGSSVWVNFLAGHVMANAVPRQQFGFIQSKMYPIYFRTMAFGLAASLLAHVALHPWESDAKTQRWQDYNLLFSLALTLINLLLLEPRATKAMFEKLRIEKEEGRGTDVADIRGPPNPCSEDDIRCKLVVVGRKLKLLHRISSTVNMLTLMSLTWHLVYLSSFIKS